MATYVNDLRLKEIATGDESGTWGTSTNTNLELIANAMGLGAETIPNASTHTITMADGTADEFRSTFLRLTGGGTACTVTLAPNTLSHTWIMRNETAAALTLTQGSGANVVIAAGQTKIVSTDGGGVGAIVYEMDDLELAGNLIASAATLSTLAVTGALTVDTNTLVVDATNNRVGIGTSTPDTTLHLQTPSGTKSEINFAQTAVTNYRIGVPASTDALVFTYGASTERIRLNSAGSVGINNPNPAQTLSICNPANPNRNGMEIAIGASDTSSNTIQNYNRATAAYTPLNIVGSILTFGSGGGAVERLRIDANGSISIPNQNAINELTFTGTEFTNVLSATTSGFQFGTTGAGYLALLTNNSEAMRIDSAGNLMVGGTSLNAASSVGFTAAGQIRQVFASGVANDSLFGAISGVSNGFQITQDASNNQSYIFHNGGAASVTIDAAGSVGIGGNPIGGAKLGISKSTGGDIFILTDTSSADLIVNCTSGVTRLSPSTGTLALGTGNVEKLRIDSSGRLLVNTSSVLSSSGAKLQVLQTVIDEWSTRINNSTASPYGLAISYTSASPNGTANQFHYCTDTGGARWGVYSNGGVLNYSGNNVNLSDRNAKKDITLHTDDEWNCVKAWEIVDYRYNDEADDSPVKIGVIAQQIQEHCPDLVNVFQEQADAVEEVLNEDGEVVTEAKAAVEERIGVNEAQMMWKVTKALQEAMERIETLEAKVQTLENN